MKKTPKSTVAKHVFGELTLKDILPMVADCDSATVLAGWDAEENEPYDEWIDTYFEIGKDKSLVVFKDETSKNAGDPPILIFEPRKKIKVKRVDTPSWKESPALHWVEYEGQYDFKLYFKRRGKPFVFDFI